MDHSRRTFIRNASLGVAGLYLAQNALWADDLSSKKGKLGVALVGLGKYSTEQLAPALQDTKHCYLAGIVSGTPSKIATWRQKYDIPEANCYSYETFDSIAKNKDIDVVYIVLPPSMHREYVERAAKAGKHVWCEKPMATSVEDCEAMIKACNDHRVSLSLGYRMHHEPNTQEVIKLVKSGEFGKPHFISAIAGVMVPDTDIGWRQKKSLGGGALLDMGVYAIQAARYTTHEEPISVYAQYQTHRKNIYKEVEEAVAFQLNFPSGTIASCYASFGLVTNYLKADYEKGWLALEPFQSYKGVKGKTSKGDLDKKVDRQQALQMDNEAQAIINGRTPIVPGSEGLKDIKVVEAIQLSAKNDKVVKIWN